MKIAPTLQVAPSMIQKAYIAGILMCLYTVFAPSEFNLFGHSVEGLFLAAAIVPFILPVLSWWSLCDRTRLDNRPSRGEEERVRMQFMLARAYALAFLDTCVICWMIGII